MKNLSRTPRFVVIAVSLALMAGSAFASKSEEKEDGKYKESKEYKESKGKEHKGKEHKEYRKDYEDNKRGHNAYGNDQDNDRRKNSLTITFDDQERRTVRDYYGQKSYKGSCPPGLAKKNNGCMPPGQAKKWHKGRPIAKDTRYYELPNELRIRLPAPPINHKYVRIAGDILLITVGSGIVVDAIEDILR